MMCRVTQTLHTLDYHCSLLFDYCLFLFVHSLLSRFFFVNSSSFLIAACPMQTYPLTIPTFDRIRKASLHVVLIQPDAAMNPFVHLHVGLNHVTVFVAPYGRLSFPLALNSPLGNSSCLLFYKFSMKFRYLCILLFND